MVNYRDFTTAALLVDAISLAQRERVEIRKGLLLLCGLGFHFCVVINYELIVKLSKSVILVCLLQTLRESIFQRSFDLVNRIKSCLVAFPVF